MDWSVEIEDGPVKKFSVKEELFLKRKYTNLEIIDMAIEQNITEFTIILRTVNPIYVNNPYKLKKEIIKDISDRKTVQEMRKTRNGAIIIKTNNCVTAKEILKIEKILDEPVIHRLAPEGLQSEMVINGVDREIPLAEILEEIEEQGVKVLEIRRFTRKEGNEIIPTGTLKVSHIGKNIKERLIICFEVHRPKLYIERPRQCFQCWLFGHRQKNCRGRKKCRICSENHDENVCTNMNKKKCCNCDQEHEANATNCEKRNDESEILKIKAIEGTDYASAKRTYFSKTKGKSFANVVQSKNENKAVEDQIKKLENENLKMKEEITEEITTIKEGIANLIKKNRKFSAPNE